ncbi:MAG TPA: hypothetical protein VGD63_01690, partial [Steroidobacteraceae bacterium]
MNHLLRAMGFWVWGLIAIAISAALVSLSFRMIAIYRSQASPTPTTYSGSEYHAPNELNELNSAPPATVGRISSKTSPLISQEIAAAQKAMRASQWSEALQNLDAAEAKSPLTPYDKRTIYEFKGLSYVRLNNLQAAQAAYETALATKAYELEELVKAFRLLFQLAATNQQTAKAIEYGKQASDAGSANDNDLLIMSQLYYQQKDCKNSSVWGDKA